MTFFALIHGAGDGGWYWHLVEEELRARGHVTVAPDLPTDDPAAGVAEHADAVVAAIGRPRGEVVVVAQSAGAFVAPLVAEKVGARLLVLLAGMVPVPGETPYEWFDNTGWQAAVQQQAALDGGLTGSSDPMVCFYHDVPRPLAEEAMRRERPTADGPASEPWPMPAWPDVPTRFVLCTEDRFFPAALLRKVARDRLGITDPIEIRSGHCAALAAPRELARILTEAAAAVAP